MHNTWLPLFNASLIGVSGIAVIIGYIFIRKHQVVRHHRSMITATVFAALFLIVYLIRSAIGDERLFPGHGISKDFYLGVLTAHIILATAIAPLALITLYFAFSKQIGRHRRIARWTFPIWLIVVASGWLVYLMLYQISWS